MNIPYIEFLFRPLRSELPDKESLDEYIDEIIPKIVPYSEDLYEEEYYTEKLWREISDKDSNLNVVVHILKKKDSEHDLFNASNGADYMVSIDGDISKGNWTRPDGQGSNIITLKIANKYELYEKIFINDDFFILKKHGDKWQDGGRKKYLVLGKESQVKDLEWREVVELLFDIYRYRIQFILMVLAVAIIVFIVFALSVY